VWCSKVHHIKALQEKFTVRISVEKGQRINRIRIQGPPNEVTSALDKIHHIFHEVTKQEHEIFVAGQVSELCSVYHELSAVDCMNSMLWQ